MGRPRNPEPYDDAANKRRWRAECKTKAVDKDKAQRLRSAFNLLEREGCLINGVVIHDPRDDLRGGGCRPS